MEQQLIRSLELRRNFYRISFDIERILSMECKDLLNELLGNIFIPEIDLPIKLPDTAGAYLICAKDINILPVKMKELEYVCINDLPVLYVGIAGRPTSRVKSLRKRDYKNHFNGNARTSTLRKSLGGLFGFEKKYESEMEKLKIQVFL